MPHESCGSFGEGTSIQRTWSYFLCPHSAVIGEIDTDKDATIDFSAIRAEPLPQIHF